METRRADGTVSYASVPKNTYYLGHVVSDPNSMVAVSDEGGLVCTFTACMQQFLFTISMPVHLKNESLEKIVANFTLT